MKILDLEKTIHNLDVRAVKSQQEWGALEKIEETGTIEIGGETISVAPEKLAEIKVNLTKYRQTVEAIATQLGVEIVWKAIPGFETDRRLVDNVPL